MLNVFHFVAKTIKNGSLTQNFLRFSVNNGVASSTIIPKTVDKDINVEANKDNQPPSIKHKFDSNKSNLIVAAVFASLKSDQPVNEIQIQTPFTDSRISKATTVNELLSISEGSGVSRRHALKVVSVLADWTSNGKVQLSDFETDARFIKLCKVLVKSNYLGRSKSYVIPKDEDLSVVLNVTADDEAAKLVAGITLPQMVKVMASLSEKKRRSTPLLRSLAYNITRSLDRLDLKQAADLLYGVASLNFPDQNLLEKISNDICANLSKEVKKSVVIGSMLTSFGLLRYKNIGVLDALSDWILKNYKACRCQDIVALILTLGIVNHQPLNNEELFKTLIPLLTPAEVGKPAVWLDVVWALVLLGQVNYEHLSTVFEDNFISKINDEQPLRVSSKLKLLNISAASELLLQGYNGPRLSKDSSIRNVIFPRSREKEAIVSSLFDSLQSLFTSEKYLKTNINTGMGFYIDASCAFDKKSNPIPLDKAKDSNAIRIAIMAQDFHDTCRGRPELTGISKLYVRLLEAQGYRVLVVPYTEYNIKDRLIEKVQYIESKLKDLVQM